MSAYLSDEENDEMNQAQDTSADTLDKGREIASEALDSSSAVQPIQPTYSQEEMLGHFKNGTDYTQEQIDAMTDDQWALYSKTANDFNAEPPSRESQKESLSNRLALADEMRKRTEFIMDHTEDPGDESDHSEAQKINSFVVGHTSAFAEMDDEDVAFLENRVNEMYETANKNRGHLETAWDGFKKGYWSTGNMIYQGGMMLKPGELTQENAENINGSMQANEDLDIYNPQKIGGVENIHSIGDAIDWLAETVGENATRGLVATGAAALGAYAMPFAPVIGSIVMGSLGTMAMNTGEAVQDQMNENRNDGDIRNSRGWALAQGAGYSLLDGAFGVSAWGGKIWAGMLRKAGVKQMARTAEAQWAKEIATKASVKGMAKEIALHGVLGEGAQEVAQSQVIGRGLRWLQTGSIYSKKENGERQTPADALLEAVNEFAGGAAAGLTFGLLGGASAHADAKRTIKAYNKIEDALNDNVEYQKLDDYTKLLVKRHLVNDSYLATTETITPEQRASFEKSNQEIDAEIARMGDPNNRNEAEKAVGQSARAYLDIFKSQYTLEDLEKVCEQAKAMGITPKFDIAAMEKSKREYDNNGVKTAVYTEPNTHISIAAVTGEDGKTKYVFNNAPEHKNPVFSSERDEKGNRRSQLVCDTLEEAFNKAQQLDIYNQWREKKMAAKAAAAEQVFNNLFGGRGVKLKFVDRPTNGDASVGISTGAYDPHTNTVELSLDNINNLGMLYTTLIHERSHEDIVEFLMKSKDWTKQVGEKTVFDWDAFDKAREEMFAKVSRVNALGQKETAEDVSKKYRDKSGKALTAWGKSAGEAGEEMVVERNSVYELAQRLRSADRGLVGGIVDKVKSAIGMKMAMDMGIDPRAVMTDLDANVKAEMDKIFQIGYLGQPSETKRAPAGEREVIPGEGAVLTDEEFASQFGKPVEKASDPTISGDNININGEPSGSATVERSPQLKDGEGASMKDGTIVRNAEGDAYEKVSEGGTHSWRNVVSGKKVGDEEATKGGYVGIEKKGKSKKVEAKNETAAKSEVKSENEVKAEKPQPAQPAEAKAVSKPKAETKATPASKSKASEKKSRWTVGNESQQHTASVVVDESEKVVAQSVDTDGVMHIKTEKAVNGKPLVTETKIGKDGNIVDETESSTEPVAKRTETPAPEVAKTEAKKETAEAPKAPEAVSAAPTTKGKITASKESVAEYDKIAEKIGALPSSELDFDEDADEVDLLGELENAIDMMEFDGDTEEMYIDKACKRGWKGGENWEKQPEYKEFKKAIANAKKLVARFEKKFVKEEPAKAESKPTESVVDTKAATVTAEEEKPAKKATAKKEADNGAVTADKDVLEHPGEKPLVGIDEKLLKKLPADIQPLIKELYETKDTIDAILKDSVDSERKHFTGPLLEDGEKVSRADAIKMLVNDIRDGLPKPAAGRIADVAKKIKKDEKPGAVIDKDEVKLTAKQMAADKALDDAISHEFQFVNDAQRKTIKEVAGEMGKVKNITENRYAKGYIAVDLEKGVVVIDPDGKRMSLEDIRAKLSKGKTATAGNNDTARRLKTILTMPQISEASARELAERAFDSYGDDGLSSYSDDKLLRYAVEKDSYIALGCLWRRWVVNPPERLNGGLPQWFRDKGVAEKDVGKWLDRVWNGVTDAIAEAKAYETARRAQNPDKRRRILSALLGKSYVWDSAVEAWDKSAAATKGINYIRDTRGVWESALEKALALYKANTEKERLDSVGIENDPVVLAMKSQLARYAGFGRGVGSGIGGFRWADSFRPYAYSFPYTPIIPTVTTEGYVGWLKAMSNPRPPASIPGKSLPASNGMPWLGSAQRYAIEQTRMLEKRLAAREEKLYRQNKTEEQIAKDAEIRDIKETISKLRESAKFKGGDNGISDTVSEWLKGAEGSKKTPEALLGGKITAASMFYSIANRILPFSKEEVDAINERKRVVEANEEESRKREAEAALADDESVAMEAFFSNKTEAEVRHDREIAKRIPPRYFHMSEEELCAACVQHDGMPADPMAQQEAINRLVSPKRDERGRVVGFPLMDYIIYSLKDKGIKTSYDVEILNGVLAGIKGEWTDPERRDEWINHKFSSLLNQAKGIAKKLVLEKWDEFLEHPTDSIEQRFAERGDAAETSYLEDDSKVDKRYAIGFAGDDEVGIGEWDIRGAKGLKWDDVEESSGLRAFRSAKKILKSQHLSPSQRMLLVSLVNTWAEKVDAAYTELEKAKDTPGTHKAHINKLSEDLRKANSLEFDEDSVIAQAAMNLDMLPKVYKAKLSDLIDKIEFRFVGDKIFWKQHTGKELSHKEREFLRELEHGEFEDVELRHALEGISDNELQPYLNYDVGDIMASMERNGDSAMRWAVKMAEDGKTDDEIRKLVDEGALDNLESVSGVKMPKALLIMAYDDYGWIDRRSYGSKSNQRKQHKELVGKVIDAYQGDVEIVSWDDIEKFDFLEICRKWMTANKVKIDKEELGNLTRLVIGEKIRKANESDRNRRNRELAKADHKVMSALMEEYGGLEEPVRSELRDEGYSEKRIKSMFTHLRAVQKGIDKATRNAIERAALAERERGLTDEQKASADKVFAESGRDFSKAQKALKNAGWNEDMIKRADAHLRYQEEKRVKSNDELVNDLPYEAKRQIVESMLAQTGEAFMTDEEVLAEAQKLGLDELSANGIIHRVRPVVTEMTDEQLLVRKAAIPDWGVSESEAVRADSAIRHEALAEAKKVLDGLSQKTKADAKFVKPIIDNLNKFGVKEALAEKHKDASPEAIRALFLDTIRDSVSKSRKGASAERIDEMLVNYTKVMDAERKLKDAEAKVAELSAPKGESAKTSDSGVRHKTIADRINEEAAKIGAVTDINKVETGKPAMLLGFHGGRKKTKFNDGFIYSVDNRDSAKSYAKSDENGLPAFVNIVDNLISEKKASGKKVYFQAHGPYDRDADNYINFYADSFEEVFNLAKEHFSNNPNLYKDWINDGYTIDNFISDTPFDFSLNIDDKGNVGNYYPMKYERILGKFVPQANREDDEFYKAVQDELAATEKRTYGSGIFNLVTKLTNPLVVHCSGRAWDELRMPSNLLDKDGYVNVKGLGDIGNDVAVRTDDIAQVAKEQGYDGVVFLNVKDSDTSYAEYITANDIVAFSAKSVKDVDSVTYDDKGKVIPVESRLDWSNDDMRFKTIVNNPQILPTKEALKENGLLSRKYRGRSRVRNLVLDRQAQAIYDKGEDSWEFRSIVEKAKSREALSDLEVRVLVIALGEKIARGSFDRLTNAEMETNDAQIEELVQAVVRAGSSAGASLEQFKHGIDIRDRDTVVYLKAKVRAQLEKEAKDQFGFRGPIEHAGEIEAKVKELEGRLKEQEAELQRCYAKIDEQQAIIDKRETAADNEVLERAVDEAERKGFEEGVEHGREVEREEEKARRLASIDTLVTKFGANASMAEGTNQAMDILGDLFGKSKRFAGNPNLGLTDKVRGMFAVVLRGFDNDEAKARAALVAKYDEQVGQFFDQYIAEENKKAVSSDGTVEGKRKARARNVEREAKKVSPESASPTEIDVGAAYGEESSDEDAPAAEPKVVRVKNAKGAEFVNRLHNRCVSNAREAMHAADMELALAYTGEYIRNLFKLDVYTFPDRSLKGRLAVMADQMNRLVPGQAFDEEDARDALLGRGSFKPMTREDTNLALKDIEKAKKLLDEGKVEEAAKVAKIKFTSDAEILDELERRLAKALNKALNQYESRINEENNERLFGEIRKLVDALKDIQTNRDSKNVGTLLDRYLDLAVGMKDYRRQRSLLERILSRKETYERKLAESDFEAMPKRENPDNAEELMKIQLELRNLERLRERFKHERELWRMKKKPWLARNISSIFEILGEFKAVAGSMDLSSVLRQGGQMTWAHPLLALKNLRKIRHIFNDESAAVEEFNKIWLRPNAKYYQLAGIEFTDWGSGATNAEDLYLLNQYRKIANFKLLKNGVEWSERSFSMFLNLMRADLFDAMVACSAKREASAFTVEQLKAIGNYINIASQRGCIDQSGKMGKALQAANAVLWSPRNIISRFQFIVETLKLPLYGITSSYGSGAKDGAMRWMFAKETARYLTGVACMIAFAKLMADLFRGDDEPPEEIVIDPRSSSFLEVKVGNTHLDFLSGLKQMLVFASRFTTGKTVNSRGQERDIDRFNAFGKFLRSKASPASGVTWDILSGENYDKQDILWTNPLVKGKDEIGVARYVFGQVSPLAVGDIWDQMVENGVSKSLATSVLSFLGAGANTYDSKTYKQLKGDFQYYRRLWREAETQEERANLDAKHPVFKRMSGSIEQWIKNTEGVKREIAKQEKYRDGLKSPSRETVDGINRNIERLKENYERYQKITLNHLLGMPHPMDVD